MLPRHRTTLHRDASWTEGLKGAVIFFIGSILLVGQVGCAIPLLTASASGDTQAVLRLLQQGHHANETFPLVETRPLILASASGQIDTVKALLDAGADVNAKDVTGWTALHAGAFKGDAAIVSLLLERGALSGKSGWFIQSPSETAEMLGHKDIVDLLKKAEPPAECIVISSTNPPNNSPAR
jgi:ankyrin repeat protein